MSSSAAALSLDSIVYPVTTLGPGERIGLWVRGCTLACRGCITPQLFRNDAAASVAVDTVAARLRPLLEYTDRITVSGGEPFQQAAALVQLIDALRPARPEWMVYSGYTLAELEDGAEPQRQLLSRTDILVDGRFEIGETNLKLWRGSDNQRIHRLSDRARRCVDYDAAPQPQRRRLEVHSDGATGLRMIGIPHRDLAAKLAARLGERGVAIYG